MAAVQAATMMICAGASWATRPSPARSASAAATRLAPLRPARRRHVAAAPAAATPAAAASAIGPYPDPFPGLTPGDDLPDSYGHPGPNPPKHRRAGIVLHPTSLPGQYGMGEMGAEAYRFVDWLAATGMQLWQVRCWGDAHWAVLRCSG